MARPAQELPSQEAKMPGPVGFIGLGIMGRPMAKHLVKAGHSLVVHDLSQAPVQELVGLGAQSAGAAGAGGGGGASEGTLSIGAGGARAVFAEVLPIFQAMGKTITHLGPLGSGGFTKL